MSHRLEVSAGQLSSVAQALPPRRALSFWAKLCAIGLLASPIACKEEAVPKHTIRVTVVADDASPLPGAELQLDAQPAGTTDANGVLAISRTAPDGTRIVGRVACPEGYETPEPEFTLVLAYVQGLTQKGAAPIVHTTVCRPKMREAVLLVKTGHPGVRVEVDGKEAATTDADGYAHIHLQRSPESRLSVKLNTEDVPKLQPVNPSRVFQVEHHDEVFVYSQEFIKPKEKKRRRRSKKKKKKHIPVRL